MVNYLRCRGKGGRFVWGEDRGLEWGLSVQKLHVLAWEE